jgi:LuxR family maltose regulon positive regulatory protein
MSMQAIGQGMDAERFLLDEYEGYENKNDVYALFLLQSLCLIYLKTGQLSKVNQTAQVLVQRTASGGMRLMKYWGDWFLGVVNYHRNELEASAQHFTEIVENRFIAQIATFRDAVAGLAMIHQTRGETSEAWQMLEKISQFDLIQSGSEDNRTRSLRARVMSLQGDLEGASQWVDNLIGLPPDQTLMWLEEPQLTRVRILLARGKENDIGLAIQILDSLYEITNKTHNVSHKIEVLALRALALDRLGDTTQAVTALAQALEIARSGGLIRVFLDLGNSMQILLKNIQQQDASDGYLNKILGAFESEQKFSNKVRNLNDAEKTLTINDQSYIEPLTPRELEVLSLLRGSMSIKEIALTLNISYATVKRHSINIYAKLGVNNRRNAVARAEELKILSSR